VNAWQTSASFLYSTSGAANCLDDAAKDFAIAGVQLEVGSVATDFEHEDYGRLWRSVSGILKLLVERQTHF
jgi:hypothetical protein